MRTNLSVMLIDSNILFRAALKALLSETTTPVHWDVSTLAEAKDITAAGGKPDVVLVEPVLHRGVLIDWKDLGTLRHHLPESRIMAFSDSISPGILKKVMQVGLDGYLVKDSTAAALHNSIVLSGMGERVFPGSVGAASGDTSPAPPAPEELASKSAVPDHLSMRDVEVLHCLIHGSTNREIGRRFNMNESAVKVHLHNLMRKIGCTNRTQAAIWARSRGMIETMMMLNAR